MIISMLVIRNFAFPFLRERKCWVFLEETLIFWLSIFFYRKWTSLWAHMSVGWLVGLLAGWLFVLSYFRAGNYTFMLQSEHLLLVSIFFYFALSYVNLIDVIIIYWNSRDMQYTGEAIPEKITIRNNVSSRIFVSRLNKSSEHSTCWIIWAKEQRHH